MRLHIHRPAAPHRTPAAERAAERSVAELHLGSDHPLVRSLSKSEIAYRQLVTVTAVQVAGVVWFLGDWPSGLSLAIGAGVAQATLGSRAAALGWFRRDLCREVIADGGAALPLPCIERTCRRLLDPRALERLASSVDELVLSARCPGAPPLLSYPLADGRVIRAVTSELRQVAALLRGVPAVRGVALVEWLLTSPATPLYGTDVELLRQELGRARYLLRPE
jgi:hypothetical protein